MDPAIIAAIIGGLFAITAAIIAVTGPQVFKTLDHRKARLAKQPKDRNVNTPFLQQSADVEPTAIPAKETSGASPRSGLEKVVTQTRTRSQKRLNSAPKNGGEKSDLDEEPVWDKTHKRNRELNRRTEDVNIKFLRVRPVKDLWLKGQADFVPDRIEHELRSLGFEIANKESRHYDASLQIEYPKYWNAEYGCDYSLTRPDGSVIMAASMLSHYRRGKVHDFPYLAIAIFSFLKNSPEPLLALLEGDVAKQSAAPRLLTMFPDNVKVARALIAQIEGASSDVVRVNAAAALGNILSPTEDAEMISPLIDALKCKGSGLRQWVAHALGKTKTKDPLALQGLLMCLEDRDSNVREKSAWALGELGNVDAIAPLERLAQEDKSAGVKNYAKKSLHKLSAEREALPTGA